MVFFSARQWNIRALKQIIFVMFFALFIGEYLVFLITAFIWNVPVKSSEDDLKVLLISDPQIQVIYNSTFTCSSHKTNFVIPRNCIKRVGGGNN